MRTKLLLLLLTFFCAYCGSTGNNTDNNEDNDSDTDTIAVADCSTELPSLSPDPIGSLNGYDGAFYEGPLFETSLQMGDSGSRATSATTLASLMNTHNIIRAMTMFGVDAEDDIDLDLAEDEGLAFIAAVINAAPCRIHPFFIRGTGDSDSLDTDNIETVITTTATTFGTQILRGVGELEIYKESWGLLDADAPGLTAIYDIAAQNNLNIFAHWAGGPDRLGPDVGLPQRTTSEKSHLATIFESYPDVNFIFHLFPTDIETEIFDLMDTYDNFYFSVDLSHFLQRIPWARGLLECFSDGDDPVTEFVQEFDANVQAMLDQAVERYQPLIEAHPDQFMWGTENVEPYDFEAEVFSRAILFTRAFIAQLDESVQEKFAYQNAEALFGPGIGEISGL